MHDVLARHSAKRHRTWRLWSRLFKAGALLFVGLTFCLCSCAGVAQSLFTSKLWQVTDGLPSEVVQAFAQTPDHYLWIGTPMGLLRFDGSTFVTYNRQNTPEFSTEDVFCLTVTRDGSLWIGMIGGGLLQYREGKFRAFGAADGLTSLSVRTLYQDTASTLWVGTDGGLFALVRERLESKVGNLGLPPIAVHSVIGDHQGALWAGGTTLVRIAGGVVEEFRISSPERTVHIKSILQTRDGTVWVGTVAGLYRLNAGGSFEPVGNIRRTVRFLKQTADGTLWIGTIGDGMYTLAPGAKTPQRFQSALAHQAILSVFEDLDGNIWVGTQAGLQRLSRTPVTIVPVEEASSSDFGSVFRDTDGTIWMCSAHMFRMRNGVFERYEHPALKGLTVRSLLRDRDGSLWAGTEGSGLRHITATGTTEHSYPGTLVSNYVRALLQAQDGSIWVGTDSGVSHITANGLVSYRSVGGHAASVMSMVEDRQGDVWVGAFSGLMHLHHGQAVDDATAKAFQKRSIWALHAGLDGVLWIGSNDGLYRVEGATVRHFGLAEGLSDERVYQILEGPDGRMWVSTPSGVFLFTRQQLTATLSGQTNRLPHTYFAISEDFVPAELFGSIQSSGLITPEGDVWFPSTRGAVHILPTSPVQAGMFPVKITEISADGKPVSLSDTVRLSSGSSRLAIDYSPILLASQGAVRYRSKLEGFDKDWQEVGKRRTAYYTNIPPGTYTFRVAAYRAGDPLQSTEASLLIVKSAPFYSSPWFFVGCLLTIGSIIFIAHKMRLHRIQSRFQAVLEERSRLAREMHDTVIQGCTTISALLEASAGMRAVDEDSSRELDELARKQIETTIVEARHAVWNLRHGVPLQDDIETGIAKIAQDAGDESARPVVFTRYGQAFPVNSSVAHELLMVIREAVHNALLHGDPGTVRIDAVFCEDSFLVYIKDDGRGFDLTLQKPVHSGHFGLQGMQERTRRIGAQLTIESALGEGTLVTLRASVDVCRNSHSLEEV